MASKMQSVGIASSVYSVKDRSMFSALFHRKSSLKKSCSTSESPFTHVRPGVKPSPGLFRWSLKKRTSEHLDTKRLRTSVLPAKKPQKSHLVSQLRFCTPAFLACPETLSLAQERADLEILSSDADSAEGCSAPDPEAARNSKQSGRKHCGQPEVYYDARDYFETDDMAAPPSAILMPKAYLKPVNGAAKPQGSALVSSCVKGICEKKQVPDADVSPDREALHKSLHHKTFSDNPLMPASGKKGRPTLRGIRRLHQRSSATNDGRSTPRQRTFKADRSPIRPPSPTMTSSVDLSSPDCYNSSLLSRHAREGLFQNDGLHSVTVCDPADDEFVSSIFSACVDDPEPDGEDERYRPFSVRNPADDEFILNMFGASLADPEPDSEDECAIPNCMRGGSGSSHGSASVARKSKITVKKSWLSSSKKGRWFRRC